MTKNELIEHLQQIKGNPDVMIIDGFNGQGFKRTINFAPNNLQKVTKQDAEESGDCVNIVGKKVIVIGYGCY